MITKEYCPTMVVRKYQYRGKQIITILTKQNERWEGKKKLEIECETAETDTNPKAR